MSIVKTINPHYDFWEMHPDLEVVEEFADIKKEYKKQSSNIMWFIVFCFDLESKFINLIEEERFELVSKDLMKDIKFYKTNRLKIQPAIDMYIKMNDTANDRHMRTWMKNMDKRTKFLDDSEYDLDNFEKLDKMAANTKSLMETEDKIKERMKKEKGVITRGGAQPSLADGGEI